MTESAGCDTVLLGREQVRGTTNAASLAALVRLLARRSPESRRHYRLRCSVQTGLELVPTRRTEDEGFESDEDLNSLGSCDDATSNSSLSCFVEDHALKGSQVTQGPSPTCSLATDSANSSGASDNDDAENTLLARDNSVPSKETKSSTAVEFHLREVYSIGEVAFCHTDSSIPKTVVWVVKTRNRKSLLNSQLVTGDSGLEAIVFQARSEDKLRELCSNYQELSRRHKLDLQFKHPHRRKEVSSEHNTTLNRHATRNSLHNSSQSPTRQSSNSKPQSVIPTDASVNVRTLKPTKDYIVNSTTGCNKYNLVQRTDDDGVTHIEVSRGVEDEVVSPLMDDALNGPSSIISISTPDDGNILVTSTAVSCNSLSISKYTDEIESVIRTDVDTSVTSTRKEHLLREWRPSSPSAKSSPPQRPERRKFAKKAQANDPAPVPAVSISAEETKRLATSQQKVVRGQFVRVNVKQATSAGPLPAANRGWMYLSEAKPSGQVLSFAQNAPSWSSSGVANNSVRRLKDEDADCGRGHKSLQMYTKRSYQRRSRSSGSGRRSRSPPARRTPMAYRYIDTVPEANTLSNRFFGKLREIASGSVSYGTLSRRRNSSGDLTEATAHFYHHPLPKNSAVTKSTPNLKSVIKKTGKHRDSNGILEPKKVTFSAYATVQVVD